MFKNIPIKKLYYFAVDNNVLSFKKDCSRIIMYHGVSKNDLSITCFKEQLKFLKNHFDIIHLNKLIIDSSLENNKGKIALTFDDGLRNNYTNVYPILCQQSVPATFFVCPGLIERQEWLWTHDLRRRMEYVDEHGKSKIEEVAGIKYINNNDIIEHLKKMRLEDREKIEFVIKKITKHFNPSNEHRESYDIIKWEDIKNMDMSLVNIGSHTVNHSNLITLDSQEMEYEIIESKNILENKLKTKVDLFCYPNGYVNDIVKNIVRRHYKGAVTTKKGLYRYGDDPYMIKRIATQFNMPLFTWRLYRP